MAIETSCPECKQSYVLRDHYAGATVRCRECQAAFRVKPAASETGGLKRQGPLAATGILLAAFVLAFGFCIVLPMFTLGLGFAKQAPPVKPAPEAPAIASAPPITQPRQGASSMHSSMNASSKRARRRAEPAAGPEKTTDSLLADLQADDPKIRQAALTALGKRKDPATISAIAERLKDPHDRHSASDALKAFGLEAEPPVIGYLEDADKAVAIEACRILQKIGTQASLAKLEEAAQSQDKNLAKEAQDAITAIQKRGP
jgi:HEAT repeats